MAEGDYGFWIAQLQGEAPSTTPGLPHAGFFENNWRESYPNPHPTIGGPRRKVRVTRGVVAIWKNDEGEWLAKTDNADMVRLTTGIDDVDEIFSRVCRHAIDFHEYTGRTREYEWKRSHPDRPGPEIGAGGHGDEIRHGTGRLRGDGARDVHEA